MNKSNGPWEIKESKEVYQNQWIQVREDKVVRPDGQDGIFGVVEMQPGVSILPIDDEGNVYLVEEFKYAIGENSLEVISGGIDEGESPEEAAKRELQEETGLTATTWIDLGLLNPFTSVIKSQAQLFLAKNLQIGETQREGTEKIKMLKLPFEKVIQMVMESKITHGQSVALILKAARYLNQ